MDSRVQSLMIFSHIFLSIPPSSLPFNCALQQSLEMLLCLETWPHDNSFLFFFLCRTVFGGLSVFDGLQHFYI